MALTDDQRAMLQLLLERDQSYDDIASLLGLGVDDVRARARAALTEMGGRDPDAEVGLTDYLLGQSDPIGRADAARHLAENADARDLAGKLIGQLRLLAPSADLPDLPGERAGRRSRASEPAAAPAGAPRRTSASRNPLDGLKRLDGRQRRILAALVGGGLVVLAIVVIAAGVFGGDGDDGGATTDETTASNGGTTGATGSTGVAGTEPNATFAVLEPQNGTDATGGAEFGQLRNKPYLQINASGLAPSPEGDNYVIWLYGSDDNAFPLSFEKVGDEGTLRGLAPIPAQVLAVLSQGRFNSIDISLTDVAELQQALKRAQRQQAPPPYVGESVLRGRIQGPGVPTSGSGGGGGGGSGG